MSRQTAQSLLDHAVALGALRRFDLQLATYQELERRFLGDPAPHVREIVANALFQYARLLGQFERDEEELAAYRKLDRRYREDLSPTIRRQVVKALFYQGVALGKLGRDEEELEAYGDLDRRFGEDRDPATREWVAVSLRRWGIVLGIRGRDEDGLAIYDALIDRFGSEQEPRISEVVVGTFSNAVFCRLHLWQNSRDGRLLSTAIAMARKAVARGGPYFDLAYALALAGTNLDEACACLERALSADEVHWDSIAQCPDWDKLRTHPHYIRLQREFGGNDSAG